ncbi:amidohydrolase [Sphingobacteriales bacterium UPWRP_1]|nr:hypothetical protein BVG80_01880 [Sphingobacteriales bacterium TSM_CSM]PSJ75108.1 amidohydrolase [Sphingobacteriales bacterium UPWRP_1]
MKTPADVLLHNACIFTVNAGFTTAQALAIAGGRILETGSNKHILGSYHAPKVINLNGAFAYPGFYDAHCHLLRYARQLGEVHLFGAASFNEVLQRTVQYRQNNPKVKAIIGRGWNQNLWQPAQMPNRTALDALFPDVPVLLTRVDLHAAVANRAALDLAGIDANTQIDGGIVEVVNGQTSGLVIDNALYRVETALPAPSEQEFSNLLIQAQNHCFQYGLTSVADALVTPPDVKLFEELYRNNLLKLRIYAMMLATEENMQYCFERGMSISEGLTLRTFKFFADGALGSRGAWLQTPYSDAPDTCGLQLLHNPGFINQLLRIKHHGFQVATHAIGDAANHFVVNSYANVLPPGNNLRWRLEHAQIIEPQDINLIRQYQIIPSVQPTHATSDMYWVKERIGKRVQNAYTCRRLLQALGLLAAGSDFPVEHINPLLGFYAATARKDVQGYPPGGFFAQQALTRVQALKAMTIWAAYAAFEEHERGSLQAGKLADIAILDTNLMTAPLEQIPQAKVLLTLLDGKTVYEQ